LRSLPSILCLLAYLVLTATSPAQDLIIESRKEGQNYSGYKETAGAWIDSQTPGSSKSRAPGLTNEKVCGSRKVTIQEGQTSSGKVAAARFSPNFKAPGHYYVYGTWALAANATPVFYEVRHAKGTDKVTAEQNGWGKLEATGNPSANSHRWVPIGDYDFLVGPDQYVEVFTDATVVRKTKDHALQLFSDAVRFSTRQLTDDETGAPKPVMVAKAAPSQAAPFESYGASGTQTAKPDDAKTVTAPEPVAPGTQPAAFSWLSDIGRAQNTARASGRKILLFFFTPEAVLSKHFESVFEDPGVKSILASDYVGVRLNFNDNYQTAAALQVFKAGTISVYDANGACLDQISERIPTDQMATRLKR
jgi:hypothetical protein